MWFNSTQREEPYLGSNGYRKFLETGAFPQGTRSRGAAWLSSARVVRCWVKSRNERNPCPVLLTERCTLRRPPAISWRKVGTTSSPHGLYILGYTRVTMPATTGRQVARWSKSLKSWLSSDWGLQLIPMKLELLVMAHQLRRREYVPRPCTHRPSHHESRLYPKSPLKRCRRYGW